MKKILVVDDDSMFRSIMRRNLESMGYQVTEFESGIGVKAWVERNQPVACLIDIVMDGKEGVETITDLKNLLFQPRIIAVSSTKFYLEIVKALGADAILLKPVTPATLEATLRNLGLSPN